MIKTKGSQAPSPQSKRLFHRGLVLGFCLLTACGAMTIPFIYETQTLWYKVGIDKTLLQAGQMSGLLAAVLIFAQILLAVRGKLLENIFGVALIMRCHRINGLLISLLAVIHVLLVLVPEGIANLPIGKKHWPEMVGAVLIWVILSMAISSQFRERLGLVYSRWRTIHRISGYIVLLLLAVHILFVSESFEAGLPRIALLVTLTSVVISVIVTKISAK